MKALRIIPDSVRLVQAEASDPAVSAFVAANAGSGKTHVLAQRVIRLMLDGVERNPQYLFVIPTDQAIPRLPNAVKVPEVVHVREGVRGF